MLSTPLKMAGKVERVFREWLFLQAIILSWYCCVRTLKRVLRRMNLRRKGRGGEKKGETN